MSDVAEGGATAFPVIRRAVFPKKGTAVFWWNLHYSGIGDLRTKHGGCPVLVGNKWGIHILKFVMKIFLLLKLFFFSQQ